MIAMDWGSVAACVLGGASGWLTLFVREQARKTYKAELGPEIDAKFAAFKNDMGPLIEARLGSVIEGKLATFKGELIKELNGTYKRRELCDEIEGHNVRRIEVVEKNIDGIGQKLDALHTYTHSNKHAQSAETQNLIARVESQADEIHRLHSLAKLINQQQLAH
jgi:hypothetical protein